jgi:uracil-DNA glycosylase
MAKRSIVAKAATHSELVARPVVAAISAAPSAILPVVPAASLFDASDRIEGDTLELIREDLGECTRCRLHQRRNKIVFGAGNPRAELVFVGEGPGHDEDVQGLPFVGRAGKLLTQMIEAMGLKREDVYIANVVKCRPPEDSISRFRGTWFDYRNTKLMVTYHPAYLLRNPAAKSEVWKDLQKVMAHLGLKAKKASR